MKVISANVKTSSIRLSVTLCDILKKEAEFVSQIPASYVGLRKEPLPYFIMEETPLLRIVTKLKEQHSNDSWKFRDVALLQECVSVIQFMNKEKPILLFLSVE